MASILEPLVFAGTVLTHRLDEHIVELGFATSEYLVMRAIAITPDASAAEIRRSLGMRDAAFSALVARAVGRGYVRTGPPTGDRRTRSLELSGPGRQAARIAMEIHRDLEAGIGTGPTMLAAYDSLVALGRSIGRLPRPELLADGLPLATA